MLLQSKVEDASRKECCWTLTQWTVYASIGQCNLSAFWKQHGVQSYPGVNLWLPVVFGIQVTHVPRLLSALRDQISSHLGSNAVSLL